jgi:hypothetical protein
LSPEIWFTARLSWVVISFGFAFQLAFIDSGGSVAAAKTLLCNELWIEKSNAAQ